jgi:dihydroorotate dehydrogenase (NAD+) catalytic subunit
MGGMGGVKAERTAFSIGGARFRNRVFLASGPAGYGTEYAGLINLAELGAIVTKTITLEPRRGNSGRRIWETSGGLLNSVGLENVGAKVFFEEKLPALINAGAKPIVSLGAEEWESYCSLLEAAARSDVDAVELNLSCPNVEEGGMAVGKDPARLARYVRRAKDVLAGKAVLAKLTPNVSDVAAAALAAEEGGADAITAINTVVGMDITADLGGPVFRRVAAGLSGPAILPIALAAVWRIVETVRIPVIGVGGISTVGDAEKFFAAGAAAVQIGTAIFFDPELPERVVRSLEKGGIPRALSGEGGREEEQ